VSNVFQPVPHPWNGASGVFVPSQYQRLDGGGCHLHSGQRIPLNS
jgi:hypothetical protein